MVNFLIKWNVQKILTQFIQGTHYLKYPVVRIGYLEPCLLHPDITCTTYSFIGPIWSRASQNLNK